MNHKRTTKRTLALSLLVMLLCVAMLVGTTFAWFTDSASTAVNKIQAGTLDIELQYATAWDDVTGVPTNWEDAEGKTLSFRKAAGAAVDEPILWEPGCTYELPELRIVNKGNLALKYKIVISGIAGDAELNEAIEWGWAGYSIIEGVYQSGRGGDLTSGDIIFGSLKPNTITDDILISGSMKKEAGNEYRGLSIDGIGITVVATQDAVENDSYGNEYDKNAQYSDVTYIHATGNESLKSAITQSQTSEKPAYIGLAEGEYQVASADTIGSGATLAGEGIDKTIMIAQQVSVSKDDITIKDMTIKGDAPAGNYGAMNIGGKNTVIENVKFNGQGMNGDTKGISVTGENLTIRNSNISNAFRGIIFWDNIGGNNLIENCTIDNVIYTFNINANTVKPGTTLTVKNSTLNGWTSYSGCMSLVSFEKCNLGKSNGYAYLVAYADTTFTDCTFNDGYQIAAGNVSGKTITITNCKLADGTVITAENFAEKLGDVDNDMKNNTVIVNGVTVSWN